jgi:hypothetical protein
MFLQNRSTTQSTLVALYDRPRLEKSSRPLQRCHADLMDLGLFCNTTTDTERTPWLPAGC